MTQRNCRPKPSIELSVAHGVKPVYKASTAARMANTLPAIELSLSALAATTGPPCPGVPEVLGCPEPPEPPELPSVPGWPGVPGCPDPAVGTDG